MKQAIRYIGWNNYGIPFFSSQPTYKGKRSSYRLTGSFVNEPVAVRIPGEINVGDIVYGRTMSEHFKISKIVSRPVPVGYWTRQVESK